MAQPMELKLIMIVTGLARDADPCFCVLYTILVRSRWWDGLYKLNKGFERDKTSLNYASIMGLPIVGQVV